LKTKNKNNNCKNIKNKKEGFMKSFGDAKREYDEKMIDKFFGKKD